MATIFQRNVGDLLVLLAAVIWGVAFYFQKTAMEHVGPFLFIGARCLVAALVLVPFAIRESANPALIKSMAPYIVWAGSIFFIAGSIQQFGIKTATVTNAGFLTALYVVATPFAYWAIKREAPNKQIWIAVAISATGTFAISGGQVGGFTSGDGLIAFSAMFWGIHIVVTQEAALLQKPLTFTCLQFFVAAALGWSFALAVEPVVLADVFKALPSILYVGMLSSAVTFGIMAIALQHIPAPRATIILSFEVVFSALAGYLLLDERLTLMAWLGALLILASIIFVRLKNI